MTEKNVERTIVRAEIEKSDGVACPTSLRIERNKRKKQDTDDDEEAESRTCVYIQIFRMTDIRVECVDKPRLPDFSLRGCTLFFIES